MLSPIAIKIFVFILQKKFQVIERNKKYKVKLDVGFKLFHVIYYQKIDIHSDYEVIEYSQHTTFYMGVFNKRDAVKKASTSIRSNSFRDKEEDKIHKEFKNQTIKYSFDYWYRCNYECEEYDESSVVVVVKKIKWKKV